MKYRIDWTPLGSWDIDWTDFAYMDTNFAFPPEPVPGTIRIGFKMPDSWTLGTKNIKVEVEGENGQRRSLQTQIMVVD